VIGGPDPRDEFFRQVWGETTAAGRVSGRDLKLRNFMPKSPSYSAIMQGSGARIVGSWPRRQDGIRGTAANRQVIDELYSLAVGREREWRSSWITIKDIRQSLVDHIDGKRQTAQSMHDALLAHTSAVVGEDTESTWRHYRSGISTVDIVAALPDPCSIRRLLINCPPRHRKEIDFVVDQDWIEFYTDPRRAWVANWDCGSSKGDCISFTLPPMRMETEPNPWTQLILPDEHSEDL
jgi:hypothetical protein